PVFRGLTGEFDELLVVRTVTGNSGALEPGVLELLRERRQVLVVTGVNQRVGLGVDDILGGGAVVRRLLRNALLDDRYAGRLQALLGDAGQTHAVIGLVVDQIDLLGL